MGLCALDQPGSPGRRAGLAVSLSVLTCPQVIGGAGLDVDFTLESPQGVLLVSEARKADGVHT